MTLNIMVVCCWPAVQVYLASSAPPVRFPNVYGVDMPNRKEFVAHGLTEDQVGTPVLIAIGLSVCCFYLPVCLMTRVFQMFQLLNQRFTWIQWIAVPCGDPWALLLTMLQMFSIMSLSLSADLRDAAC
jgi:hypothetical protein